MRATFRPLPAWPYPPRPPAIAPMRSSWEDSLDSLEREIELIDGEDVLIGLVLEPEQVGLSGNLRRGGATRFVHPGVEVSFESKGKRLVFHTDAYKEVRQNIRAIALGLESLRAVDRYGITSTAEQYAGFAQLPSGAPDPDRGRALVAEAGSIASALKKHHPDHGGSAKALADVVAYKKLVGA